MVLKLVFVYCMYFKELHVKPHKTVNSVWSWPGFWNCSSTFYDTKQIPLNISCKALSLAVMMTPNQLLRWQVQKWFCKGIWHNLWLTTVTESVLLVALSARMILNSAITSFESFDLMAMLPCIHCKVVKWSSEQPLPIGPILSLLI